MSGIWWLATRKAAIHIASGWSIDVDGDRWSGVVDDVSSKAIRPA